MKKTITVGNNNIAIGYQAMSNLSTGSMNVAIGRSAIGIKPVVLTPEQKRLERAALRFTLGLRGERRGGVGKYYVASLRPIGQAYGKITRDSVRDSLLYELNARGVDGMGDRKRLGITKLIDKWIEDHLEMIGRAKFSGDDE